MLNKNTHKLRICIVLMTLFLILSCESPLSDFTNNPTPSVLAIQLHSDSVVFADWTQCFDEDFGVYVLWRSQSAGIQADPSRARALKIFTGDPLQKHWFDTDILPGKKYWYALETRNTSLRSAWSNELCLTIPPNELDKLTVFFIDPSYEDLSGDVILIRTPNGFSYLIDGGDKGIDWSCGRDRILPVLDSLGVTSLAGIVATHPHSDHIGGLIAVLKGIHVDRVWDCGWTGDASDTYEDFLHAVRVSGAEYILAGRGMKLDWDPDLYVEILNPESSPGSGGLNNASIVIRLEYEEVSFMFTGDLETDGGELNILANYSAEELQSDVLKIGHHGSNDATCSQWLDVVQPSYAAIEVGAGNLYGHPHSALLNRLDSRGITVYRTDSDGTFVVITDGINITVL